MHAALWADAFFILMTKLFGFRREPARVLRGIAARQGLVGRSRPMAGYPDGVETGGMMVIAKVGGTAISKASDSGGTRTCGTGTVTFQVTNDSDELTDYLDDDGNAVTATVLNWSLEDSGTDTYVSIEMGIDGKLYYVNEPC